MSKHNYSQYSNKNKKNDEVKVTEAELNPIEAAVEQVVEPVVEPEVEVVETPVVESVPETATGVVFNCTKLNVRLKPTTDAMVACILEAQTKVEIDLALSNSDWYYVTTAAGINGYCMRQFIKAN